MLVGSIWEISSQFDVSVTLDYMGVPEQIERPERDDCKDLDLAKSSRRPSQNVVCQRVR